MNLVETWVTNITQEKIISKEYGTLYELTADTDCYGNRKSQETFIVTEEEYNSIKSKGYYLT